MSLVIVNFMLKERCSLKVRKQFTFKSEKKFYLKNISTDFQKPLCNKI